MRIALGCDHGGFPLKQRIASVVQAAGHEVVDCGTDSNCSVDYPDFARKVGETILVGKAERGILLCGSGVGISVAANKIPGIRAGVCHDIYSAHQGSRARRHERPLLDDGYRFDGLRLQAKAQPSDWLKFRRDAAYFIDQMLARRSRTGKNYLGKMEHEVGGADFLAWKAWRKTVRAAVSACSVGQPG